MDQTALRGYLGLCRKHVGSSPVLLLVLCCCLSVPASASFNSFLLWPPAVPFQSRPHPSSCFLEAVNQPKRFLGFPKVVGPIGTAGLHNLIQLCHEDHVVGWTGSQLLLPQQQTSFLEASDQAGVLRMDSSSERQQ